jgi:hypothetical protein
VVVAEKHIGSAIPPSVEETRRLRAEIERCDGTSRDART